MEGILCRCPMLTLRVLRCGLGPADAVLMALLEEQLCWTAWTQRSGLGVLTDDCVSLLLVLGWPSWSATLWPWVHPRSHPCLHHPHTWPSSQQLQCLRCIFRIFICTNWRGHLNFTKAFWSHILNEWVLCLFSFFFFLLRRLVLSFVHGLRKLALTH